MSEQGWRRIISGDNGSLHAGAARAGLSLLEPFYGMGIGLRNAAFDFGLRKPRRLGRPVISVGNLTVGGTGKTPMVMELAARLLAMGAKPAILLRGYDPAGSWANQDRPDSDELELHRRAFEGRVPVEAHRDRSVAATVVLQQHEQTDVFLLDDGFQRRQTHRDLNIVLIDATEPFGYGRLLPRGLLREPARSLKRADAVIVTRADRIDSQQLDNLAERLASTAGEKAAIIACDFHWSGWRTAGQEAHAVDELSQARVFAFCGIANPSEFVAMLNEQVGAVVGSRIFTDHYRYDDRQLLKRMVAEARELGAEALVTTEKDWVKLHRLWDGLGRPLALYRPVLKLSCRDDGRQIDALLANCLANSDKK